MNLSTLPRETLFRFPFFLIVSYAATFDLANAISPHFFLADTIQVMRHCLAKTGSMNSRSAVLCQLPVTRDRLLWDAILAVGVLCLGVVVSLLSSRLRRSGLKPIPDLAAVTAIEEEVTSDVGTNRIPLIWRETRPINLARADGILHRYIEVGPTFLAIAHSAPDRARAILRHEYAHHQMKDILPSRIALWLPWVIVAFALFTATWTVSSAAPVSRGIAARTVLVVVLMFAARSAFLRARETAADMEVTARDRNSLAHVLSANPRGRKVRKRIFAIFATHPRPERRVRVIRHEALSCTLGWSDGVLVGLTAAVATPVVSEFWAAWFGLGQGSPLYSDPASWTIIGALLGAWVGAVFIRAVAARALDDGMSLIGFSMGLGASIAVGGFILLCVPRWPLPISLTFLNVSVILLLGIAALAVTWWIRSIVEWWFTLKVVGRSRRIGILGPLLTGGIFSAALFGSVAQLRAMAFMVDGDIVSFLAALAARGAPYGLIAVAIATLVPLGLSRLTGTGAPLPPWLTKIPAPR